MKRYLRLVLVLSAFAMTTALVSALPGQQLAQTGFEDVPAGAFERVDTGVGRWVAERGHAVIDAAHHRSGRQCLHITGGQDHKVVLAPTVAKDVSELVFWAERWTRRDPFVFRVERLVGGKWRECYRGDEQVVIGTFKTQVRVPLAGKVGKLRFVCTSPAGVLIDDLRFARAEPMRVSSVTTTQPTVPCLVGNASNRVALVEVNVIGSLAPLAIREVGINLDGTTSLRDIQTVELHGQSGRIGKPLTPAKRLLFRGDQLLEEGRNALRVAFVLAADADIDHVFDAGCDSVAFSDGSRVVPEVPNPPGAQRGGVALRNAGDSGAAVYRIPGIATTKKGTLVAVYDIRWRGGSDLPADIDVGMSRSVDAGKSWEPMRTILDMGRDPKFRYDGVGDPAILYDHNSEAIWVAATWSHGNRSWRGSGPGLDPEETGQVMLTRSVDDGQTWSDPINITRQVKKPEWCFLLPGPGRGICMRDGTLVFPAQYQDTPEKKRIPRSTILFSKDRGTTWQLAEGPRTNTTESQVVELRDGELMLNMRDNRGGSRAIYTTRDLGKTWREHPTSRRALVEPVCNAALLAVDRHRLLFVNPSVSRAATAPHDHQAFS